MPAAAIRFPERAVFGELRNFIPRTKSTATAMKMRASVEVISPFLLEHLQHSVRDHEPAKDVG